MLVFLSLIAVALGIGPGWQAAWTFQPASYDATNAVLTATLIALIWTAAYTYHLVSDGRLRDEREDARRESARKSLLSGLVSELDHIDNWLATVRDDLYQARLRKIERTMLSEALRNTHLLSEREASVISTIYTYVNFVENALSGLIELAKRIGDDPMRVTPQQMENFAPLAVDHFRTDIDSIRKGLKEAAEVLSPSAYATTKWSNKQEL